MKLIIYFTKTNTTKKVAYLLADKIGCCDVVDGTKISNIDLSSYDSIIIGTYIRINKPNKKFIRLIKKLKGRSIKINCFLISANKYKKNEYITSVYKYLSEASLVSYFGGELNTTEARGLTKIVLEACIKDFKDKSLSLPALDLLEIEFFAEKIKNGQF